jgi:sugar phosphate isomerase/epimerase
LTPARYATRLNAFVSRPDLASWPAGRRPGLRELVARAGTVRGLTDVDLNYPDHVEGEPKAIAAAVGEAGLAVNGLAMRYYTNPAFKLGAFTNPDPLVRREAIDLTKRGIDAAREVGAPLMTLWLGQDGFDYAFQLDYARAWSDEIGAIREVCDHDPECLISIEYKPSEPRSFSLLPDCGTTLLAVREVDRPNLGVTLDMAHVLFADEQPAFAAALVARHSRLLGLHLNDGYGKRDDGLMVGSVHPLQTIELLLQARRDGYRGAIYFDTFPDASGLDPVAECEANIATADRMLEVVDALEHENSLSDALARQDPVASGAILRRLWSGG